MPEGMELKDYGRLQKDGELRIRGHDDNRLKSRYVFVFDKVMIFCKSTRVSSVLMQFVLQLSETCWMLKSFIGRQLIRIIRIDKTFIII